MPLRRKALLEGAALFAVTLLLARWQIGRWDGVPDFDGHYHLRVVYWIAHHGLWTDIPWLPFTVLGERGPDHHWLWHLALLPFAWFGEPAEVLLWANAFNAAATVAAVSVVMRLLGVPAAPLFALLAVSAATLMPYRLLMLRTQNAAVVFMMLAFWAMVRRRERTLALIAFLFLESYHAAVVLGPMALIGCGARTLAERRLVLGPLVAVAAGLSAALLISPWFPRNIEYLMFHLLFKTAHPLYGEHVSALIGTEWYPPGWQSLLLAAWPAHLMLAAAVAVVAWQRRHGVALAALADTLLAIGVAVLCLVLYYQAVRFVEYYVPFAALAAGLAMRHIAAARRYVPVLVLWFAVAASAGVLGLHRTPLMPRDHLAKVGERLNGLGGPGDVVFNSSWSDFMALVWWADAFRYVNGLDGHYLAYGDPARFAIWLAASAGALDDPAAVIAAAYNARFVVVAPQHERLRSQLERSPRAVLHLASPHGWLFELR